MEEGHHTSPGSMPDHTEHMEHMHMDPGATLLFNLEKEKFGELILFVTFLLGVSVLLLLIKVSPAHQITKKLPESCLLIVIGIITAGIAISTNSFSLFADLINADIFFLVLLPPIILDSAYSLYCKQFIFNLDGILLLAVVGTALNTFAIGLCLHGTYGIFNSYSALQMLLLASILAAVDPVAVLAVFNDVGVERGLYILIFGESLLNDGVTVVLFDCLAKIAFIEIEDSTYAYAIFAFFPVSLGGTLVGIVYGAFSSLACKYTTTHVRILEPTLIFLSAYMSYVNAQLFHWSGILALITCGLVQKRYGFENISEKSRTTIEMASKMLASVSESIIFLVLGYEVLEGKLDWDYNLLAQSIVYCTIFRVIFTFMLGWSINTYRLHKLTFSHLFMMSYGGLRGAVAFAMAKSINAENKVHPKFLACTLGVILFTVFVQGSTVRFFVDLLNFKEVSDRETFTSTAIKQVNFHVLAGMETILGGSGSTIHYWLEMFQNFDQRYVQPFLCVNKHNQYGFSAMLAAEGRMGSEANQNHMMWGALSYAEEKLAGQTSVDQRPTEARLETKKNKKKVIKNLNEAMRRHDRSSDAEKEDTLCMDEHLNTAWKRKLELIKALKNTTAKFSGEGPGLKQPAAKSKEDKTSKIAERPEQEKKQSK